MQQQQQQQQAGASGAVQWPDHWEDEAHEEVLRALREQNISLESVDGRPVWVVILGENRSESSTMVTSSGRTSVVLFGAFLSVWTLLFNLLLCFLLCRGARRLVSAATRTQTTSYPSRVFVLNFSLSQLFLGSFVIPLSVATERTGSWPLGSVACRLWLVSQVMLVCVSMWALLVLVVDRFVYIIQPVTYSKYTPCWGRLVGLVTPWLLGTVTSIPLVIWLQQPDYVLEDVCAASMSPTHAITLSISAFLAPALLLLLATLLLSVAAIFAKLQQNHLRRHALGGSQDTDDPSEVTVTQPPTCCIPPCCPNVNYVTYAEYRHVGSVTATLVAVNVAMVTLWTPFYVTNVLIPFCQGMCVDPTLWSLFIWLGYASSGISPVLWLLDPQVRHGLRALVTCSPSSDSIRSKSLPEQAPAFV